MKLRIRGNSIRLRLEQHEVRQLAESEVVEEIVTFPASASFSYILRLHQSKEFEADFTEGTITVAIPYTAGKNWAEGEDVGIYSEISNGEPALKLAIEKDFQCLHKRPDEDESDMFDNPKAAN